MRELFFLFGACVMRPETLKAASTSDEFNAPLYITIAAVSAVLLILALILSKHAKKKEKPAAFDSTETVIEVNGFGRKKEAESPEEAVDASLEDASSAVPKTEDEPKD